MKSVSAKVSGLILAGGKNTRFGYTKALVFWQGKTLIEFEISILTQLVDDLWVVTNYPDRFGFIRVPMVVDEIPFGGPLLALKTGLKTCRHQWVLVVGCDLPFLSPDLLRYLLDQRRDGFAAVVPYSDRGPEPLCAIYHKNCVPAIELLLEEGKTALLDLISYCSIRRVESHELTGFSPQRCFFNLNRPEDYETIKQSIKD